MCDDVYYIYYTYDSLGGLLILKWIFRSGMGHGMD
jgi:hypothetical protein